ncbi:MAG: DedA family protein [Methanomassiliicoccales archaeon]
MKQTIQAAREGFKRMGLMDAINQYVIELISTAGYPGLFLAMFIEGILTPIPSELIMPLGGYLASTGRFSLPMVILVGSLGAMCGSSVAYGIARALGRPLVERYGRYIFLDGRKVKKAEDWFQRWGSLGILLGHAAPGIRSIISFPAGIFKMELKRFVIFTFFGALVWNSVLSTAGYLLGEYYIELWKVLDGWDLAILAIAAILVVLYLYLTRKKADESTES